MHGIVSRYKQTGVQMHLDKNHQVDQRISPFEVPAQQEKNRCTPAGDYDAGNKNSNIIFVDFQLA